MVTVTRGGAIEIQNRRPNRRQRTGLSERDRVVLEIERNYGSSPEQWPLKIAAAQEALGLSADAYRLVLRALLDDPMALAEAPDVVEPLRRKRERRRK